MNRVVVKCTDQISLSVWVEICINIWRGWGHFHKRSTTAGKSGTIFSVLRGAVVTNLLLKPSKATSPRPQYFVKQRFNRIVAERKEIEASRHVNHR
jgi:hypothetical protein